MGMGGFCKDMSVFTHGFPSASPIPSAAGLLPGQELSWGCCRAALHANEQLWAQKSVEGSYSTREGEMHSKGCGNKEEILIYAQKSMLLAKNSTW